MLMTILCSWCGRVMRQGDPKLPISHGICPSCVIRVEGEWS